MGQNLPDESGRGLRIIFALLYLVAVVIALVGAIGLFNALAMSVLERRREIGILRSMGASAGRVAQVFWTEGLILDAENLPICTQVSPSIPLDHRSQIWYSRSSNRGVSASLFNRTARDWPGAEQC